MEGFKMPVEKMRPMDEAPIILERGDKLMNAQMDYKVEYEEKMNTSNVLGHMNLSFLGPEDRDF